jgi:hypothetical protein
VSDDRATVSVRRSRGRLGRQGCTFLTDMRAVAIRAASALAGLGLAAMIRVAHAILRWRTLIAEAALPPNTVSIIGQPSSEPPPWHL